jgi:hypothetical protein
MRRTELAITEAARRLLRVATQDGIDHLTNVGKRRIITTARTLGVSDLAQIRGHGSYLRMVSIAEAYTDRFYELHVHGHIPRGKAVAERAIEEHLVHASRNWSERDRSLKRVLGISKSGFRTDLEPLISGRNAIAHGLGELTRRQQGNRDLATSLASVDVRIVRHQIVLTAASFRTSRSRIVAYVEWLDGETRGQDTL